MHVGIATGPVVVGDTGAGDASVPKAAVGPTPNLAARLQSLAGADQIVVAPSTRRLLGSAFQYEELGEHTLKGIAEPLHASRVVDVGKAEGRFEAARTSGLTPFVGREREVGELLAHWQLARAGAGQVVLLSGEAGIGKSRITQVLRERLAEQPHTRLRYQCSPYHSGSAFHPIIAQLERAAAFERDDPPEARLDKLEATLVFEREQLASVAPLLAALLSLPTDRYPAQVLSPQKQRELTMTALADQALNLAARQPVLMIVEDMHWVDPSTLETLGTLIGRIRSASILLVLTHRPEFISPWSGEAHVATLGLQRLSRDEGASIVDEVSAGKPLPEAVLAQIVAKTDGVPLFVEELTKTVLEAGFLRDAGDRWVLDGPLPPLAIPSTLQDSLMARLDRLSPIKEVAQIGACIGREFSYSLLAAVVPMPGDQLQTALEQLIDSELMFCRGDAPEATYTFNHALVQDSAYGSLLKSRRQQVHNQIARALEERFPDIAKAQPELLARHYTAAGLPGQAVPYWLAAGERALSRTAYREAVAHLGTGLEVNDALPAGAEKDRSELGLRSALGFAYMGSLGWAAIEVRRVFEPALPLARRIGDHERLFDALYYLCFHHSMRCEYPPAIEALEESRRVAERARDPFLGAAAACHGVWIATYRGRFEESSRLLDGLFVQYAAAQAQNLVRPRFLHDPKCGAISWAHTSVWALGRPETALCLVREQIQLARTSGSLWDLLWALTSGSAALILCGDLDSMIDHLDEARRLAREHSMEVFIRHILLWEGHVLVERGESVKGYACTRRIYEGWRRSGALHEVPTFLSWMATAMARQGEAAKALEHINEAIEICERTGNRRIFAEALRLRGEILRQAGDSRAAEAELLRSLEVARSQAAKSWELRTATSLCELWASQGKRARGQALLAPVYGWFTEGFETKDLKKAKALMENLNAAA